MKFFFKNYKDKVYFMAIFQIWKIALVWDFGFLNWDIQSIGWRDLIPTFDWYSDPDSFAI